jgi:hypothetical protein
VDFNTRKGCQGIEIGLLTHGLVGVLWPCIDFGREIIDLLHGIFREQLVTETFQIKPLERRALQQAVIEVEAIDVDVCPKGSPEKSNGGLSPAVRPATEAAGSSDDQIGPLAEIFNRFLFTDAQSSGACPPRRSPRSIPPETLTGSGSTEPHAGLGPFG